MRTPFLSFAIALITTVAVAQQQPGQQPGQLGQQPGQPQLRRAQRPVIDGQLQARSPDAKIAACLMIGNRAELALSKMGQEQAQSDKVKQFAQQMEKDHRQAWQQLARFAPENQRGASTREAQASGQQPGSQEGRLAAGDGNRGGELDFVQMKREISDECLALVRQDLQEKQGSQFDECFMMQQIGAHMEMLAGLKVAERHATSPELQQSIKQQIETTQEHLKQAKEIAKSLNEQETTASAGTRQN